MRHFVVVVLAVSVLAAAGCTSPKGASVTEKRANIDSMHVKALADLYRARPELKKKVENAAGYGVFTNIGTAIIFVTTGSGYGTVVNNRTGEETYMKMAEVGVGLGLLLGAISLTTFLVMRPSLALEDDEAVVAVSSSEG